MTKTIRETPPSAVTPARSRALASVGGPAPVSSSARKRQPARKIGSENASERRGARSVAASLRSPQPPAGASFECFAPSLAGKRASTSSLFPAWPTARQPCRGPRRARCSIEYSVVLPPHTDRPRPSVTRAGEQSARGSAAAFQFGARMTRRAFSHARHPQPPPPAGVPLNALRPAPKARPPRERCARRGMYIRIVYTESQIYTYPQRFSKEVRR